MKVREFILRKSIERHLRVAVITTAIDNDFVYSLDPAAFAAGIFMRNLRMAVIKTSGKSG